MPLLRLFTEASVVYRSICCNRIVQIFAEAASAEASVKRFGRSFCRSTLRSITAEMPKSLKETSLRGGAPPERGPEGLRLLADGVAAGRGGGGGRAVRRHLGEAGQALHRALLREPRREIQSVSENPPTNLATMKQAPFILIQLHCCPDMFHFLTHTMCLLGV